MSLDGILLIEDDPQVAEIVTRQLEELGYAITHLSDGRAGLTLALDKRFALVVVDLGLPSLGGMEICRKLREQRPQQPILVLTGRSDEASTALALELGADEYVVKPLRPLEFNARVRALIRRSEMSSIVTKPEPEKKTSSIIEFRDLQINEDLRQVLFEGVPIELTAAEYQLLEIFINQRGKTLSKASISELLWGDASYIYSENLRTTVSRLRNKLETAGKRPPYIVTQRGFGYRSATEDE